MSCLEGALFKCCGNFCEISLTPLLRGQLTVAASGSGQGGGKQRIIMSSISAGKCRDRLFVCVLPRFARIRICKAAGRGRGGAAVDSACSAAAASTQSSGDSAADTTPAQASCMPTVDKLLPTVDNLLPTLNQLLPTLVLVLPTVGLLLPTLVLVLPAL